MIQKYDLIIFDCDGTLVDSESPASQAISVILTKMGHTGFTPDHCYRKFRGVGYERMLILLKLELGDSFNAIRFSEEIRVAMPRIIATKIRPIPGAAELLGRIKSYNKCVASNGDRIFVINSLQAAGLLHYFREDEIFTYQQVSIPKPAPDLFNFAAESMGHLDPLRCLVVEDSDSGIQAAISAGIDVVVFRNENDSKQLNIQSDKIKGVISNLVDLLSYLS
jgi:HAD superfamily hydrolase (TIGR01509 family)